jgi:hypothetical protein
MKRAVAVALLVLAGAGALFVITPGAAAQQAKAKPASTAAPTGAADLDLLLGPVALYPDTLLAQILLCANNPTQVTRLAQWLPVNKLTGTELQDAATVDGFDPEFVAVALFPTVVNYMAQNLDWTTKLGKAFTANKTAVFDSIQRLRAKAQKAGALKDSPQQNVETKTTSSGQEVIIIEPANPQVIYVPQYNPTVVYAAPPTQTVVVQEDNSADAAVAGLIGFTAGIAIGAAMDNDYYYGPYGWHGGAYMYNDAWNDYYDAREDAREDWMDHREDLYEERGERRENTQEQRTERSENRQENRPESSAQRQQNVQQAQANRQAAGTQSTTRSTTAGNREARGYSGDSTAAASRSGTKSDAFSGYSSGKSERAASSRGAQSRSSSRGGGGGGRRR